MITAVITTKKGVIHRLSIEKGDDFLCALDKFLKRHKLVVLSLKEVSVLCENEESMPCRIAKAIASGITFNIKSTK
ncbi:MAG: hypothetical protein NUV61_02505 [Candidatus Azambacteria bacterium]|nr:hypothetical protein [Candidatus Azambacteria bacterium]